MDVFEKSHTVDPEVRAYVYSLVSAVRLPTHITHTTTAPKLTTYNRLAVIAPSMTTDMSLEMMLLLVSRI